jgi:hypothetical protein
VCFLYLFYVSLVVVDKPDFRYFVFLLAKSRRRSAADSADLLRSYLRHALLKFHSCVLHPVV